MIENKHSSIDDSRLAQVEFTLVALLGCNPNPLSYGQIQEIKLALENIRDTRNRIQIGWIK